MRLICPNCGAQYEVDAAMIPEDGRDVQCSACGQTWFQQPEGVEPAPEAAEAPDVEIAEETAEAASAPQVPTDHETEAATAEELPAEEQPSAYAAGSEVGGDADWPAEPGPDSLDGTAAEDEVRSPVTTEETDASTRHAAEPAQADDHLATVAAAAAPAAARPSERLDDESLRVLREEAEREAAARRAEQAQALETQPELGLPEAEESPSRFHEADEDQDDDDATLPGSRGDMLPDIDQINSTLRPASEHPETIEVADPVVLEAQHRKGFRWGFTLMIVVAALLVIAYVFAPQIAQQSPAAEPAVAGYVDMVNGLRDQVEGFLTRTTESLSGMSEDGDAE